jgi:hypothetical protein
VCTSSSRNRKSNTDHVAGAGGAAASTVLPPLDGGVETETDFPAHRDRAV